MWTINYFIEKMLEKVPDLRNIYQEHLDDNDELLPHVFMADVTRFVLELLENDLQNKSKTVEDKIFILLELIENALREGNEDVKDVIILSFLENLEQDDFKYSLLKEKLGRESLKNLNKIEVFYS